MSKLNELIHTLCPEGVEFKQLWEVTIWDKKFNSVDRAKQPVVISYPYLLANDLFSLQKENGNVFLLSTGEQTGWTTEELAGDNLCEGEVVTIPWGKSRAVTDCIKYFKGKFVTADNRIATSNDTTVLLNKFLYYWMMSQGKVIDTFYRGSGIKHPSMKDVLDMKIPVPPIEVQCEIVRILDNFTELTAELTAELIARKKQYEYYCRALIDNAVGAVDTRIGDFGKWSGGMTPSMSNKSFWEDGTIPWVSSKDMKQAILCDTQDHITQKALEGTSIKLLPKETVAIVARSGILKHTLPIVYIPVEVTVNQDIKVLVSSENILPKYAYYCLVGYQSDLLAKTKKQGGTVDSLEIDKFMNYKIPVPLIPEQKRIVAILNRFDTLCNDISSGLPAEIEARQKQYEYYRDKLLAFGEVNV